MIQANSNGSHPPAQKFVIPTEERNLFVQNYKNCANFEINRFLASLEMTNGGTVALYFCPEFVSEYDKTPQNLSKWNTFCLPILPLRCKVGHKKIFNKTIQVQMSKIKNRIIFGTQHPAADTDSIRYKYLLNFLQASYDIKVIGLDFAAKNKLISWYHNIFQLRNYRKLILKTLKIFDPDLIHLCSPLQASKVGYELATAFEIPFIYEVRQLYGEESGVNPNSRKLKQDQEHETTIMYYAEQIITISDKIRHQIMSRGIEPQKISVIPDGIDASRIPFTLNQSKSSDLIQKYHLQNKKVIGFRYLPATNDGKALLIRLIPELIRNVPDLTFFLISDGNDIQSATDLIRQMNLSKHVIPIQKVNSSQLQELYLLMDLVIFPCTPQLISPDTILEAMTLGKTILVAADGEVSELIQNGVTGFLFQPEKLDNLITKCVTLLQRDTLRHKIGAAARSWIQQHCDWNFILSEYRDIYERILTK
jgi:glycosyltransferase involved in cell wall biosynthesis